MKVGLSLLGEHPQRKTGITSLYHELVGRSLRLAQDVSWVVFVGPNQDWPVDDPRVEVVRDFPAGDQMRRRLWADHFQVAPCARARGADRMLSTGFVPIRKCLPTAMHVLSLQHLDPKNRVGFARSLYRHGMMRFSWRRADLVITNSHYAAQRILAVYPEFANRLVQSYEGLQHEIFHPRRAPDEWAHLQPLLQVNPGYVLWLSNLYPYKQAELLIAAYARLSPELRRHHPLVIVGGDWEDQLARNQRLVHDLGIDEHVRFLGWVADECLAPLYRHAAVHCLASREETFGRTLLESMACGTPVVANDIPAVQEILGPNGLIVDFTQTERVTAALHQVLTDEATRTQLRQRGLARAQDFSFDRLTLERLNFLRQLRVNRSGPG